MFHAALAIALKDLKLSPGPIPDASRMLVQKAAWLRDRGDLELDAFIEAIPYDETRGYTKRVLSSFLTYSWLWPQKAAAAAQDGVESKPADKRPSLVPILPFPLPPPPAAARKASATDQSAAPPVAAPAVIPVPSQVEPSATAAASTDTAKPAAPASPPAAVKSPEQKL